MSLLLGKGEAKDMTMGVFNRIYYPVCTLGYGRRLGIWMQGCIRRCIGCMSPEMQPFLMGNAVPVASILEKIPKDNPIDGLTISGGEPFEQSKALKEIVAWFLDNYCDDILVYTGYRLEELIDRADLDTDWVLKHISVLIDGPYEQSLATVQGIKGSSNQKVHIFSHFDRYQNIEYMQRKIQYVNEGDRIFAIGLSMNRKEDYHG